MSRKLVALGTLASLLGSAALADVPNVATDISPVHSLVARVMAGVGEPSQVIASGASPHEYNLRQSEARALQDADLVFWIGEDLTPWLEDSIETLAEDADVVTLLDAEGVTQLAVREGALFEAHVHEEHGDDHGHDDHDHDDHGHDDHEQGHKDHAHDDEHAGKEEHDHDDHGHDDHAHDHDEHADEAHDHDKHADHKKHDDHDHEDHADGHDGHHHGEHDPHAWLSPENASVWLNTIAAALSAADPDNAGTYFANAAAGREDLAALTDEIDGILDPVRGKSFVVFHDAYQYFETEFDFPASGAISLSDATDPSPARIAEIQARVADEGIECVLSEPQFNQSLVATVMDGTQAKTAVIDPLGVGLEPGPEFYPQLLRNLATSLADCL